MAAFSSAIAIDIREACRPRRTGKGQWTRGLVAELIRQRRELVLVTDTDPPPEWSAPSVTIEKIPGSGITWHMRAASFLRQSSGIRFYLSTTSYIVPALLGRRFPCVPVVHDLIAFRDEPHERKARLIERWTLRRAVRCAAHIFTVSDATKQDLLKRYASLDPATVTSVFAGPMNAAPARNEPDGRTILCVATLSPRKNQMRLIRAFEALPHALRIRSRLVLAGARGWQDGDIVALASSTSGVEWKQYVNDAEYERLLHTCHVFALPSLYEGFGMQVLDALQRGIPVLTSDRGSLAEVAGDAAYVIDPESAGSIAKGLERLLTDATLRERLSRRGPEVASRYSWERTAGLVMGVTKKIER